jgi:glutathione S-transferase
MELVLLIIVLALFEYIVFSAKVGMARVKYQVHAPAITGHPIFERLYRVQMNTLEQLIVFIPAIFAFTYMAEAQDWPGHEIAAFLGVIWIIGRALYARAYVRDPAARGPGFLMTFGPTVLMLLLTLVLILLSVI